MRLILTELSPAALEPGEFAYTTTITPGPTLPSPHRGRGPVVHGHYDEQGRRVLRVETDSPRWTVEALLVHAEELWLGMLARDERRRKAASRGATNRARTEAQAAEVLAFVQEQLGGRRRRAWLALAIHTLAHDKCPRFLKKRYKASPSNLAKYLKRAFDLS